MKHQKRLIGLSNELRRAIAEWAKDATDGDLEQLGEQLQPLRTDLAELCDGSYDPSRLLSGPPFGG
jgi:hypothetical protein